MNKENFDPKTNGFELIGRYKVINDQPDRECFVDKISERVSLVYLLVCRGEILYIGETIQGYRRPLGYLKNKVMSNVRDGILGMVDNGHEVDVYARTGLTYEFENMTLDITKGYEGALIKKINPNWNRSKK